MIDLLSDLLESLSKIIEAWEEFIAFGGQSDYFQDDLKPNSAKSLMFNKVIIQIDEIVTYLRQYRTDLQKAKESCEGNENAVGSYLLIPV